MSINSDTITIVEARERITGTTGCCGGADRRHLPHEPLAVTSDITVGAHAHPALHRRVLSIDVDTRAIVQARVGIAGISGCCGGAHCCHRPHKPLTVTSDITVGTHAHPALKRQILSINRDTCAIVEARKGIAGTTGCCGGADCSRCPHEPLAVTPNVAVGANTHPTLH